MVETVHPLLQQLEHLRICFFCFRFFGFGCFFFAEDVKRKTNTIGWWFQHICFIFMPTIGEMNQFDGCIFLIGLVQPPL